MTLEAARAQVDAAIQETAEALSDGLDVTDLPVLIRNGMQVAERMDHLTGAQKAELAERFVMELVDRALDAGSPKLAEFIQSFDVPFLPEGIEAVTVDPLLRAAAPALIKPLIKAALPELMKLVADASKGGAGINRNAWALLSILEAVAPHIGTITAALTHLASDLDGDDQGGLLSLDKLEGAIDALGKLDL